MHSEIPMEGLSLTPESFRDFSLARFLILAREKYNKGQAEHGGKVYERVTFSEVEEEIIDMWHYVQALRVKLNKLDPED
jgi:hypothetical protein